MNAGTGLFHARSRRRRLTGLAVCLAAAAAAVLAAWLDPAAVRRADMAVFDRFQARVRPPTPKRKVVAILASERSMIAIRQWPWPRSVHAELLDRLKLADSVGRDVIMSEPSEPDEDKKLVDAVKKNGTVVQAMHMIPDENGVRRLALPFPALTMNVADAGITNIPAEPDGIYRDAPLYWTIEDQLVMSFPTAVWVSADNEPPKVESRAGGFVADLPTGRTPLDKDLVFKIHHPAEEIPVYEYVDVLRGDHPEETFRDAVVFVGVNAAGASDYFPIGRSRVLAGTLYNAHAVLTLMHGWIPAPAPRWATLVAAGFLAAVGAGIGWSRSMRRGWLWAAAALLLWLGASGAVFFGLMTWLPPLLPAACLTAAFFIASSAQLRALSGEWNVSHLSIESLFSLGGDMQKHDADFPAYLESRWEPMAQWSRVQLLEPCADPENPAVRDVLAEAAERGAEWLGSQNDPALVITSGKENRMLLRLPDTEAGEPRFSLLGWKGRRSEETLKSVTVLILSSSAHFKALSEAKARRELFLSVIRLIMGAVDAKDPTTAGHSERVADLSRELAGILGLPAKEIDEVYLAGLLHDVGKIGVPDAILNFPGRLSDDDMAVMRRHPDIGADIMGKIELSGTVRAGIVEHHERLDGKGYPRGAAGESLSLAGRILKIADVYDALSSKRQYKEAMPKDLVYKILSEGAGTEFDAALLKTFFDRHFPEYPKKPAE